jgi:hypothetical protein
MSRRHSYAPTEAQTERAVQIVSAGNHDGICLACSCEYLGIDPELKHGRCANCYAHAIFGANAVLHLEAA